MAIRSKVYHYPVKVKWQNERIGLLELKGKPPLQVATPPEFKGHKGFWTPEDLFVSALASCFMTTFLGTAYHRGLAFESFEADAEGKLERPEKKFLFTEVIIRVRIVLPSDGDLMLAHEVLDFAKKDCLVSNSIVSNVKIEPIIWVKKAKAEKKRESTVMA
ncbi:MAG: OsmC family protein [bacterium]|nr:OsmC family protein [bacterium]